MSAFVEAFLTLIPAEAGGRHTSLSPREGSYRPWATPFASPDRVRLRVIEGPPSLAPGDSAMIVAEIESGSPDALAAGAELDLLDIDDQRVGLLHVMRYLRSS